MVAIVNGGKPTYVLHRKLRKSANLKRVLCASLAVFSLCMFWIYGQNAHAQTPKSHQYLGDVDGDDKADAITFDKSTGDWWIAKSSGITFDAPSRWISGFGVGSTNQFLADVNGDNRADAVAYTASVGNWDVAISCTSSFGCGGVSTWMRGHGVGSINQLVGDINGDNKSDAVVVLQNGSWHAATSNLAGNHFDTPGNWFSGGHGVGSTSQFVADVDGDSRADAIVYNNTSGEWWVSNSDAIHFATGPNKWKAGYGVGSDNQLMDDVNGDDRADAVTYFGCDGVVTVGGCQHPGNRGSWWVAPAGGGEFAIPMPWITVHGWNSQNQLLGDADGDSKADAFVFFSVPGNWHGALSSGTEFRPNPPLWISGYGIGTY